ncbi:MAG TPA: hypothetical protein PK683_23225 [Leptospiraceae bacterium]|nr:hypothetical protein [Leptospiraceae bacterium]
MTKIDVFRKFIVMYKEIESYHRLPFPDEGKYALNAQKKTIDLIAE